MINRETDDVLHRMLDENSAECKCKVKLRNLYILMGFKFNSNVVLVICSLLLLFPWTISAAITLHGHSGPVYGLSFSHDKSLLLSSSDDGTIRLWSLQTWTCLVNYKVCDNA